MMRNFFFRNFLGRLVVNLQNLSLCAAPFSRHGMNLDDVVPHLKSSVSGSPGVQPFPDRCGGSGVVGYFPSAAGGPTSDLTSPGSDPGPNFSPPFGLKVRGHSVLHCRSTFESSLELLVVQQGQVKNG